ncbi:MAG TPA: hypothetical protein VLL49_09065 [Anaerolineales bacterium]|nr:hypothetical protein [Anaerolineales bacterium]
MNSDPTPAAARCNRQAITGFGVGLLTMLALCTAPAPKPFSGSLCLPAAAGLGMIAIVNGVRARPRIQFMVESELLWPQQAWGRAARPTWRNYAAALWPRAVGLRFAAFMRQFLP